MATQTIRRSTPRPPQSALTPAAKQGPPAAQSRTGTSLLVPPAAAGNQAAYRTLAQSQGKPKDAAAAPGSAAPATLAGAGRPSIKLPPLDPKLRAQMLEDVQRIATIMKFWIVESGDQITVTGLIEKYATLDQNVHAGPNESATPNLDHFLILLKSRSFSRSSVKSLFQDQWAILYDALWYRLRGYYLDKFQGLVNRSQTQKTSGPGDKDVESGVALIAKQEAMGMWGMLKGMGTGLVGIAGPAVAQEMAESFDETAHILFGNEWDSSEPLVWGMNAGQIGTTGGDVIWQLVTFARGAGASKAGKVWALIDKLKKVMAVGAGLQGVYLGGTGIARVIEERQKTNQPITPEALLKDPNFLDQLVTLTTSAIGAVMAAKGMPASKSEAIDHARIRILLNQLHLASAIARFSEIAASDRSPEEKEREYGAVVANVIPQLVSGAFDVHGYAQAKGMPDTAAAPAKDVAAKGAPAKDAHEQGASVKETSAKEGTAPKVEGAPKAKRTAQETKEQRQDEERQKPAPTPKKTEQEEAPTGKRPVGAVVTPEGFPSVMLVGVSESQFRLVLRELEQSTPAGKQIAQRIKSGQLHMTLDSEALVPSAAGLALPKEIHVQWGSSVEDTVSLVIHEAVHQTDVALWKGGPRSEAESLARVHQFEYRAERKLPPYDKVEEIYRLVIAKEEQSGASPAAAREAARKAMVDMMRTDPKAFGVEVAPTDPVKGPAKSPSRTKVQSQSPIGDVEAPEDFSIPSIDPFSLSTPPANVKKTIGRAQNVVPSESTAQTAPVQVKKTIGRQQKAAVADTTPEPPKVEVRKTIGRQTQTTESIDTAETTPRKQSQRVLNEDERIKAAEAKTRLEQNIGRQKQLIRENLTPAEQTQRIKDLTSNPKPLPPELATQVARLPRDPDERLEALRDLQQKTGLSPESVEYLKWQEELQDLRLEARDRAAVNRKRGDEQSGLEGRVGDATAAVRQASKSIKQLLRLVGPNYRKASNIAFDQVLNEERFNKLPPSEKRLQTDHLVPLDWVANSSEMTEFLKVYSAASKPDQQRMGIALVGLGDIPDNLVRMRADANNFKSSKAWKDMSLEELKKFGYDKDDHERMIKREAKMLDDLKTQILALANEYKKQ